MPAEIKETTPEREAVRTEEPTAQARSYLAWNRRREWLEREIIDHPGDHALWAEYRAYLKDRLDN